MAGGLSLAKDWIYVFCTVIQTVLAIIGLLFVSWWWEKRKAKDERKRADQQRREEERQKETQREEDRQKADAEKIAVILSEKYYEVEEIFHGLKGKVDELRGKKIVGDLTEFHVLLYMCRRDNWHKCNKTGIDVNRLLRDQEKYLKSRTDTRDEILSDVEEIMKFFLNFRINLFSIMQNKACPDDIKSEFARKITEMGEIIYPFVEKHRQDVIERVLKYFVSASTIQEHVIPYVLGAATVHDHATPEDQSPSPWRRCFLCPGRSIPGVSGCCGRKETSGDETRGLAHDTSTEMQRMTSPSIELSNANQGPELIHYPGNSTIENAIPYIKDLKYAKGKIYRERKLSINPIVSAIDTLERLVLQGKVHGKESEIVWKMHQLWQENGQKPPEDCSLLHLIRMAMFELSKNCDFFNRLEGSSDEFKQYVKQLCTAINNSEAKKNQCHFVLSSIQGCIDAFGKSFEYLLALDETENMLENVYSILDEFFLERTVTTNSTTTTS